MTNFLLKLNTPSQEMFLIKKNGPEAFKQLFINFTKITTCNNNFLF